MTYATKWAILLTKLCKIGENSPHYDEYYTFISNKCCNFAPDLYIRAPYAYT